MDKNIKKILDDLHYTRFNIGRTDTTRSNDCLDDYLDISDFTDNEDIFFTDNWLPIELKDIPGKYVWIGFTAGRGHTLRRFLPEMERIARQIDGGIIYDFTKDTNMLFVFIPNDKSLVENLMQYYGLNKDGKTVYVAMSKDEVVDYADKHPEEGIVRVEDKFKHGYNLRESLKAFDRKEFDENSNTYELEMLYESVKTTLSAQQKNDLARFVRKAKTAEEINTYMTGMLAQGQMSESNESLNEDVNKKYIVMTSGGFIGGNKLHGKLFDSKEEAQEECKKWKKSFGNNRSYYKPETRICIYKPCEYYDNAIEYHKERIKNESLTEDIDEESFNKLKEIAYELDNYIEDKVWVRDFWYDGQFENTITFSISGDWKHDHARFDYYASEWLDNKGLDYKISEHITDDDGSDSYGADHTIRIYNLKDNLEEDTSSNSIKRTKYAADAFTIVLNNLSDKLDGYEEFGDGEFDISYQGNKRELQREIIDTFAKADIELKREHNALVYSIPNNYDAYIYITKDDEASTYTKNSVGYYARVETVL